MTTKSPPEDLRGALVVAVDDSPAAREALRYAASMAAEAGRTLHVVSVWNFVMGPAPVPHRDTPPSRRSGRPRRRSGSVGSSPRSSGTPLVRRPARVVDEPRFRPGPRPQDDLPADWRPVPDLVGRHVLPVLEEQPP